MDTNKKDGLKEQLRVMAAGRGDGIDLNSQDRWVIEGVKDPASFFRHLGVLVPQDCILYFEGCGIVPEVEQFYEQNRASNAVCVVRDTIYPVPKTFHVMLTSVVIEQLLDLLRQHFLSSCFDHVKAYREGELLFAFHDAFDGSYLYISDRISAWNLGVSRTKTSGILNNCENSFGQWKTRIRGERHLCGSGCCVFGSTDADNLLLVRG